MAKLYSRSASTFLEKQLLVEPSPKFLRASFLAQANKLRCWLMGHVQLKAIGKFLRKMRSNSWIKQKEHVLIWMSLCKTFKGKSFSTVRFLQESIG